MAGHEGRDAEGPGGDAALREVEKHDYREYGRWFLGIDDEYSEDSKSRYKFPYGDFDTVHRCGVIAAEVRAVQRKYIDIQVAAAHLHGMLDELM
jgi:hypothetical protein